MIQLNGYNERWFAGAGALGLDGFDAGHPPLVRAYKTPFRLAGLLDPYRFTVITKTITVEPRVGRQTNWGFRKYAWPVRPLSRRSMVNAVALTNPGLIAWTRDHYPHAARKGIKLVLSLHVGDAVEAGWLGRTCQSLKDLAGLQINAGCPNLDPGVPTDPEYLPVYETAQVDGFTKIVAALKQHYTGPLLVKFRLGQPWQRMAAAVEGACAGYELVNACPWDVARTLPVSASEPGRMGAGESPLQRYGYGGSVSGGLLSYQATAALVAYKNGGGRTPVISGGGVVAHHEPNGYPRRWRTLTEETEQRLLEGADAVAFSTAFLWQPWGPNRAAAAVSARLRTDAVFQRECEARRGGDSPAPVPPPAPATGWNGDYPNYGTGRSGESAARTTRDGDFPRTDYGGGSLD